MKGKTAQINKQKNKQNPNKQNLNKQNLKKILV